MKRRLYFILILGLIITILSNCNFYQYPYSNVRPRHMKMNLPTDYGDCLVQFDSILKPEAIEHFKKQDSTIAMINIVNDIGEYFIHNWYLDYLYTTNPVENGGGYTYDFKYPRLIPPVVKRFKNDGISSPLIMIRVLFNAYYKYLNNIDINWEREIKKMIVYQTKLNNVKKYSEFLDTLRNSEREVLANYRLSQLNLFDTVVIPNCWFPMITIKSPMWYDLTGIVKHIRAEKNQIKVELINIVSQFGDNYIITKTDTIMIGDKIDDYYFEWRKKGNYYFDYRNNKKYQVGVD